MDKKNTPSLRIEALQNIFRQHKGNNAETQANRALMGLQALGSLTTFELRKHLDIMHPAGRIKELRNRGYQIQTFWTNTTTDSSELHSMARYVYFGTTAEAAR